MSANHTYCLTCGLPLDVHPGLLQTCARLAVVTRALEQIAKIDLEPASQKLAQDAIEYVATHHDHPGLQKP